jgi:hypothetical protein
LKEIAHFLLAQSCLPCLPQAGFLTLRLIKAAPWSGDLFFRPGSPALHGACSSWLVRRPDPPILTILAARAGIGKA